MNNNISVTSASNGVTIDTRGGRIKRVRSILDEEYSTGCTDEFVSPIKAMKANFRMNQMFGIFPYSITKDFMAFT